MKLFECHGASTKVKIYLTETLEFVSCKIMYLDYFKKSPCSYHMSLL